MEFGWEGHEARFHGLGHCWWSCSGNRGRDIFGIHRGFHEHDEVERRKTRRNKRRRKMEANHVLSQISNGRINKSKLHSNAGTRDSGTVSY